MKRFIEDWRFRLLAICSIWICWFVLACIQTLIRGSETVLHDIIDYAYVGIIWTAASPIVIYFASIIKLENKTILVVLNHILACFFILLFRTVPYAYLTFSHRIEDYRIEDTGFVDQWLYILGFQFLGNFIIYGLIVSAYYAIVWYVGFKDSELRAMSLNLKSERLERQLSDANLTALRMQLNPHFLFNTLHSVASLIRVKKNSSAIETLSVLGELLRTTVYEGKANEITILEEVSFVKKYLSIEQLRFAHRLNIKWDIDPAVLSSSIPNLLLQPIVENALKHGLSEASNGTLSVEVRKSGMSHIIFLITDNGIGLKGDFDLKNTSGVGLRNTIERLNGIYGFNYVFEIYNNPNGCGTQVQIRIPIKFISY